MVTITPNNAVWNIKEYPEYCDEFWEKEGGIRHKMKDDWKRDVPPNPNFNNRLYKLIPTKPLKILDLGCGGGSFIESCIADGHLAYGLDGSPWYKELSLHSWAKFPNNFFVADLGKEFMLIEDNKPVQFDAITSWECFEHIHIDGIEILAENINRHSKIGTWFIFSASQRPDYPWHKTIKNKQEWTEIFQKKGFENTAEDFGRDVIRWEPDSIICYLKKTS